MKGSRFSSAELVDILTLALGSCDGPESNRLLHRSISARLIREALERTPAPETMIELADVLDGTARRPGESAQLLRWAARRAARRWPDRTVESFAREARARSRRRSAG